MKKGMFIFLTLMFIGGCIFGQSSFLKVFDYIPTTPNVSFAGPPKLTINAEGNASFVFSDSEGVFKMVKLSTDGVLLNGVQIDYNSQAVFWRPFASYSKGNWDAVIASSTGGGQLESSLFVLNAEEGVLWSKQIAGNSNIKYSVLATENNHLFCTFHPIAAGFTPYHAGIAQFDLETGVQQWGYYYKKIDPINRRTTFKDIKKTFNGRLSILAERDIIGTNYSDESILEIDTDGYLLKSLAITTDSIDFFSHKMDVLSNIYVVGRKLGVTGSLIKDTDGVVVKLDANYNILWAKKLVAEQFGCYRLEIEILPNGDLLFAYAALGLLPVITGKISSEGELLWHRGYAFAFPQLTVTNDGSILLTSSFLFNEDGTFEQMNVLAKTTPDGEIEGCPQFDACLRLEDIEITLEEQAWERTDAPFLPDIIDISMEPLAFSVHDACGVPAHPHADFFLPDTICQYSCLSPDSLKNSLANHVEWTIIGPDTDTIIVDESFEWCFDSIGAYTVEQEIWLLGCSDFFSKKIEVLPDNLELNLGENQYICRDMVFVLNPTASRPLRAFQWSNGSESSTISVLQPTDYSLTVTDGFCWDSTAISLSHIDDLLEEEPLFIPMNTTLCPDLLPYILRPMSLYSTRFYLNDETAIDSVFQLATVGIYTVNVEVENCVFSENFELFLEDCAAPVYIANVFSPNDDGINDEISPQGRDFEGIQLQVFNRWGNLIFETHQSPFSWDGKFDNEELDEGVYLLVFTYFNQRNMQQGVFSKDIFLLR